MPSAPGGRTTGCSGSSSPWPCWGCWWRWGLAWVLTRALAAPPAARGPGHRGALPAAGGGGAGLRPRTCWTPQGRVASWNPGAERIQGWRAEEMLGHAGGASSTRRRWWRRASPGAELERAARDGRLRVRGLAGAQGRHALLGRDPAHRAARRGRPAQGLRGGDARHHRAPARLERTQRLFAEAGGSSTQQLDPDLSGGGAGAAAGAGAGRRVHPLPAVARGRAAAARGGARLPGERALLWEASSATASPGADVASATPASVLRTGQHGAGHRGEAGAAGASRRRTPSTWRLMRRAAAFAPTCRCRCAWASGRWGCSSCSP